MNHVEVNTKILSTTNDESKTSHFMTNDNQPTSNTFIEIRHNEEVFCKILLVYLFKWRESLLLQLHSFLAVVATWPATKTLLACSFHTVFCPLTASVECKILHTNMTIHPMPTPPQTHIQIGSINNVWNRYQVIKKLDTPASTTNLFLPQPQDLHVSMGWGNLKNSAALSQSF